MKPEVFLIFSMKVPVDMHTRADIGKSISFLIIILFPLTDFRQRYQSSPAWKIPPSDSEKELSFAFTDFLVNFFALSPRFCEEVHYMSNIT